MDMDAHCVEVRLAIDESETEGRLLELMDAAALSDMETAADELRDTAALRETNGDAEEFREVSGEKDWLGVTDRLTGIDGLRKDDRLAIDERDMEEQSLELNDIAALWEIVGETSAVSDCTGECDSLSDTEIVTESDEQDDGDRLAIGERDDEVEPTELTDNAALTEIDGDSIESSVREGETESLGEADELVDNDTLCDDVRLAIVERDPEELPLELADVVALREIVGVAEELNDFKGENE